MGLYDFLAGEPGSNSYDAMEMRRRIAMGLMMQKKAYPKNIGEGLSSIGDSVSDVATVRMLERQQAALDTARKEAVATAETGGAPAAPAAPGRRADVLPEETDVPPVRTAAVAPTLPQDIPPPAPVAAPPVATPSPIVRVNPNGSIAGNITAPTEPKPMVEPMPTPSRSVAAPAPYFSGGTGDPYVIGAPTGDQSGKAAAMQSFAAGLRQPPPTAAPVAPMAGTPEQGARLRTSFDQFAPRAPGVSGSISGAAPMTPQDATQARTLGEVTGMGVGDRGYGYAPTASLGRTGDVQSDAPDVNGISPRIGGAVTDTAQQMRDAITKRLIEQPAEAVPQPNPTQAGPQAPASISAATAGSPPEAASNRPIVMPDVVPLAGPAPAPGAQMAENRPRLPPDSQMPPAIPPAGTPARPVPPSPAEPRVAVPEQFTKAPVRPADPVEPPKSTRQIYNERALNQTSDPYMQNAHKNIIAQEEKLRGDEYARRVEKWKSDTTQYQQQQAAWETYQRDAPKRELELSKAEDERQQRSYAEGITRMLGGVPQEVYISNLNKSKENVAGLPAATESIKRAKTLVDNMYHGPFADTETFLAKVMGSAGFPTDPRVSATEQFKTAMAGVMAQARKGIVGPGAQSEAELALLQKSTAADAKLDPETIKATLEAAERLNLQTAINHQKQVRRFAGETDPDRIGQVYGAFGVPNMVDLVPQASVNKLFKFADDPKVHRDFDNTYQTPGLSREVLRFRRAQ